jgi:hypothetical protein
MAVTPEMLKVVSAAKPPGAIPNGLKVASFVDSGSTRQAPATPALAVGGFTIWPMSYGDNRMSMAMVSYNPKGDVVQVMELKGARYVYKAAVDQRSDSVTFTGQSDQKVTLTAAQIFDLLTREQPEVAAPRKRKS